MVLLREVTHLAGLTNDQTAGPYAASVRLAATLGAPAAGTLIALFGAPAVLVVDAGTFLVSAVVIFFLIPAGLADGSGAPAAAGEAGKPSLTAGFAVVRGDRLLANLTLFAVVLAVMTVGWNSVGAPIYGKAVLGSPVQLGMLLGLFGLGALLGNLIYASLSRTVDRRTILIAALALAGPLPWIALAVRPPLAVLSYFGSWRCPASVSAL
jgi:predicted MFS family arabinose efflux permease